MMTNRLRSLLRSLALLIAAAVAMVASPALAGVCTFTGTFTGVVDFGTIQLPRDAVIAAGQQVGPTIVQTVTYNCETTTGDIYGDYNAVIEKPTPSDTFVIGNGFSLNIFATGGPILGSITNSGGTGFALGYLDSGSSGTFTLEYRLRRSSTGPTIMPGSFTFPAKVEIFSADRASPYSESPYVSFGGVSGTLNVPTCSTSNASVTLDTVSPADFGAVGAVVGTKSVPITLTCPAGSPVNVFMTVTDNTTPGNTSNILTLASESTATGVGILLQRDGADVLYGPDSSAAANVNQFQVGTLDAEGGTITVPFTASYVSTSATVTGGTVKGAATYTVSYQ